MQPLRNDLNFKVIILAKILQVLAQCFYFGKTPCRHLKIKIAFKLFLSLLCAFNCSTFATFAELAGGRQVQRRRLHHQHRQEQKPSGRVVRVLRRSSDHLDLPRWRLLRLGESNVFGLEFTRMPLIVDSIEAHDHCLQSRLRHQQNCENHF